MTVFLAVEVNERGVVDVRAFAKSFLAERLRFLRFLLRRHEHSFLESRFCFLLVLLSTTSWDRFLKCKFKLSMS